MARIYGYGEDSLTYWALTTQLAQILTNLNDDTPPADCKIVYRPSFGRKGGPRTAEFGEFDTILQSSHATYLIESKWDGLQAAPNDVVLREVQILRHRIFKWIWAKWRQLNPRSWSDFVRDAGAEFMVEFEGRTLANPGRLLARNCFELLLILAGGPAIIRNVLLYFASREARPATVVDERLQPLADPFELCVIGFPALNDSGYILMADA